MTRQTAYTPTLTQAGAQQPDLGDGTLTGWSASGAGDDGAGTAVHIEFTVGQGTVFGDGPILVSLPMRAESIGATATLTSPSQAATVTGYAYLVDGAPGSQIMVAVDPAPPLAADWSTFWTAQAPVTLTAGDTLVIDGIMRAAPPACPDCYVHAQMLHTPGCKVALCRDCGFPAWDCVHAPNWPRGMPLWKGIIPGLAEAEELGFADVEALFAAARADGLVWNATRERWERPEPIPDLDVVDYGFQVSGATADGMVRYSVDLPDTKVAGSGDRETAVAQMSRFITQAQAALEQLRSV